jgi:hypothetical protein
MVHLQGVFPLLTFSDPSQRISWQLTRRKISPASLAFEHGSKDEYRFRILTSKFSHPPRILGDSKHPKIRKPESSQQSPNDLLMSTSSPSSNEAEINRYRFKRAITSEQAPPNSMRVRRAGTTNCDDANSPHAPRLQSQQWLIGYLPARRHSFSSPVSPFFGSTTSSPTAKPIPQGVKIFEATGQDIAKNADAASAFHFHKLGKTRRRW